MCDVKNFQWKDPLHLVSQRKNLFYHTNGKIAFRFPCILLAVCFLSKFRQPCFKCISYWEILGEKPWERGWKSENFRRKAVGRGTSAWSPTVTSETDCGLKSMWGHYHVHSEDDRSTSRLLYSLLLHRADETQLGRHSCPRWLQFLAFSLDSIVSLSR